MGLLLVFFLCAGCTEYDLGRDKEDPPDQDDTERLWDSDLPPPDSEESEPPEETAEPPIDETDLPPDAATEPLYAHSCDTLFSVDPAPPHALTRIGGFNAGGAVSDVTDIAIDTGGIMYAVSFDTLYRVDASNARLTPLGRPGPTDLNALTFLADGTLLAGGGSALYEVDPSSGAFTRLSSIGSWSFAGDMVGLPDGLLYCAMAHGTTGGATSLVVYDLASQTVLRDGETGTGSLYGVAYAEETLFGFNEGGGIYTIDPSSGAATPGGNLGEPWWGATTNPVEW